jgi:hypothetical protein
MSQNSLVIPTTGTLSGVALVTAVNGGLDSLNTLNSGGSAPSAPEADQLWMDTTNNLMKQRDGGNANWYPQWVRGVAHGGGMRHSGESGTLVANTTLTTAQLGQLVICAGSSPFTLTMPLSSTFPTGTGMVLSNYGSEPVSIAAQGSDTLDSAAWLNVGDSVLAVSHGVGWRFILRGNNGQAFQSGSITATTSTSYGSMFISAAANITFPISYASGYIPHLSVFVASTGGGGVGYVVTNLTNTGFNLYGTGVDNAGAFTLEWQAK